MVGSLHAAVAVSSDAATEPRILSVGTPDALAQVRKIRTATDRNEAASIPRS